MSRERKKEEFQDYLDKEKDQTDLSNNDIMEAVQFAGFEVNQVEKIREGIASDGAEIDGGRGRCHR